jgi:serine/threonine protein phosphatase PrpC
VLSCVVLQTTFFAVNTQVFGRPQVQAGGAGAPRGAGTHLALCCCHFAFARELVDAAAQLITPIVLTSPLLLPLTCLTFSRLLSFLHPFTHSPPSPLTHFNADTQIISAEPDITLTELQAGDRFFILACDGIWDCLTNQQAVRVSCVLRVLCGVLRVLCVLRCGLCHAAASLLEFSHLSLRVVSSYGYV